MKHKPFLFLAAAILLLAAAFRLVALADIPPGLSQDEVLDAGIPATILAGNHALFFWQGYGHEPLYHYWAVPFYLMFGESVLTARLPAVFLGLLLVALTMRYARQEFGALTALVAGLGLAVSWWPIVFSRVGIRPIMAPVLLVAAALFWSKRPWLAGLLLGLSFYTYTAARIAWLIPILFIILQWGLGRWQWVEERPRLIPLPDSVRQLRPQVTLILLIGLLVAAPMQITLWRNPGLQQRVDQLSGPLDALRNGDPGPIWRSLTATLGVFSFTGDPRWTYTVPDRPLFDPVTALFFYGGLGIALWHWRRPRYTLLLAWLAVMLLPSALTPQAPSTVRLVGAMPVIYLLPGLAITWLYQRIGFTNSHSQSTHTPTTRNPQRAVLYLILLLVLLAINSGRTLRDGFIIWPAALETRFAYQTVLLDMARHWRANPASSLVVADSFFEPIDAESLHHNLGNDPGVRWLQAGPERGGALIFPGGEGGHLYVPEFAPLDPALWSWAGLSPIPLYRSAAAPSFAVYELPPPIPGETLPHPVTFGGRLTLLGYEIVREDGTRPLHLFTIWRVDEPLPWDLTLFLHLASTETDVLAQDDGFDAGATTLQPGDIVWQQLRLPLPDPAPPSLYLRLGLYTSSDGQRLPPTGQPHDFLPLPLPP